MIRITEGTELEILLNKLAFRIRTMFIKQHGAIVGMDDAILVALTKPEIRNMVNAYIDSGYDNTLKVYIKGINISYLNKTLVANVKYHRQKNMIKSVVKKTGKPCIILNIEDDTTRQFPSVVSAANELGISQYIASKALKDDKIIAGKYKLRYSGADRGEGTTACSVKVYTKYGIYKNTYDSIYSAWKSLGNTNEPPSSVYRSIKAGKDGVCGGKYIMRIDDGNSDNSDIPPNTRVYVIARYNEDDSVSKVFIGKKEFLKNYTEQQFTSIKGYLINKRKTLLFGYKWKRLVVSTIPPKRFFYNETNALGTVHTKLVGDKVTRNKVDRCKAFYDKYKNQIRQ